MTRDIRDGAQHQDCGDGKFHRQSGDAQETADTAAYAREHRRHPRHGRFFRRLERLNSYVKATQDRFFGCFVEPRLQRLRDAHEGFADRPPREIGEMLRKTGVLKASHRARQNLTMLG